MTQEYNRFERLFALYADVLYRVCFTYLGNASDSEDAVQDVFVKIIAKAPRFDTEQEEKAWIIVTACNHCKSMLRSRRRRQTVDIESLPNQHYWERENNAELLELVARLPDKCKQVIYMHCCEGYSLAEIAKASGEKESTVRSRLFYARKYLRELIN